MNKIERVKNMIAACNAEKSRLSELITAAVKSSDADRICSLQQKEDIDKLIAEKEAELKLAQDQQQIATQKMPEGISAATPAFSIPGAQRVLEASVEGIGKAYVEHVKSHLDRMFRAGMEKCSAWISEGTTLLNSRELKENGVDTCPFCGQPIASLELIEGYNQYFSQSYKLALQNARALLTQFEGINVESYKVRLKSQYEQLKTVHGIWKTYLPEQPDVPEFDVDSLKLDEKYNALKSVIVMKSENPMSAQSLEVLRDYKDALDKVMAMCSTVNTYVKGYVEKINELRSKIRPVNDVEKELKALKIFKMRFEEPLRGYCSQYDIAVHQANRLQRINKKLQADQKAASAALFEQYGQRTNYYLRDVFMTPFQISDVKDAFRGAARKPNLDYTLTFNGVPVYQGDDGMSNQSFRNVLSEGDKNTIAFSFFLAKLDNDAGMSDKIVVFDDPLTSLDQNRRLATIHELVRLYKTCSQLIVLSHNLQFLIDLNGRNDVAKKFTKVLRIAKYGDSARIELFELRKEWMDKYKRALLKMEEFVSHPEPGEAQANAISGIRLTLELFLKLKYCKYFDGQNGTFGELIDVLAGKEECKFANPSKDEVIANLKKLNEAAWRPHHASVEERDGYQDEYMTTTEACNYTKLALKILMKDL